MRQSKRKPMTRAEYLVKTLALWPESRYRAEFAIQASKNRSATWGALCARLAKERAMKEGA